MEHTFARRTFLKVSVSSAAVTLFGTTGLLMAMPARAQQTVGGSKKFGVKGVVFDMNGTVLDINGTWMRETEKILKPRGFNLDWLAFTRALIAEYPKSIAPIRDEKKPFRNTDILFRENLERVLPAFGVKDLPKEVVDQLDRVWHRIDAWPDVTSGMAALRKNFLLAPCSNDSVAIMVDCARHNKIIFDAILGAEYVQNYKPAPNVYIRTAEAFGLKPSEIMYTAAAGHTSDMEGAAATGMKLAAVARPDEGGVKGKSASVPKIKVDIAAKDLNDLAVQLMA